MMSLIAAILIIYGLAVAVFGAVFAYALKIASASIFQKSGAPPQMANVLLRSLLAAG